MKAPTHRSEHTGNAGLDRIQANVRDLLTQVRAASERIVALERLHGSGVARVVMGNANYTLSPTEISKSLILISGVHTGVRTLTLPRATDDAPYIRWIRNGTTGGFSLNITSGPTTGSLGSSTTIGVYVHGQGITFL